MGRTPEKYSAEFKFRIVLESIQKNAVAEVARKGGVRANQLTRWRREFFQRGASIFDRRGGREVAQLRRRIALLEGLIGRKNIDLSVLRDWLFLAVPSRWSLIEHARSTVALGRLGVNATCRLLGISKKSYYKSRSPQDRLKGRHERLRQLIRIILEQHPDYGYRRIKVALAEEYGLRVNHKLLKKLLLLR